MPDYANFSRPPHIPVRPGTDPYPVQARLVSLDGTETWTPATVVRATPSGHLMVRISGAASSSIATTASAYAGSSTSYIWLSADDVVPAGGH